MSRISIILFLATLVVGLQGKLKANSSPPHCTQVIKNTDYQSLYKLSYPTAYLLPGQREAYQQLYCINPAGVNQAVTIVCDWSAPPQVQFTLGDEYMHVVRQDPSGRYYGQAVITTYQNCNHTTHIPPHANVTSVAV